MIYQATHSPEDRSLEQQRRHQLCFGNLSVLWIGGVLIIEQMPETLERLLADETGEDSAEDVERDNSVLVIAQSPFPLIWDVSRG